MTQSVEVRALTPDEAEALLVRQRLGRIGFSDGTRLNVELTLYVYSEHWVYTRTARTPEKLGTSPSPIVAFEVDEVEGLLDWRTVEVRGRIEFLSGEPDSPTWDAYKTAERLMRSVVPGALTGSGDPAPERTTILRIHVDEIVGRSVSTQAAANHTTGAPGAATAQRAAARAAGAPARSQMRPTGTLPPVGARSPVLNDPGESATRSAAVHSAEHAPGESPRETAGEPGVLDERPHPDPAV